MKNIASEKLSGIWDKTVTAYEWARSIIVSKVITPVLDFSWNALVDGWNVASELVGAGFEKLKGILHIDFSGFWDTLSSGFTTVCDSLKGAWNGVTGFIKDTWNTAADYVSDAWKWTKGLFGYDTDAEDLQTQLQDITALNKMSEGFSQRVAEMTQAWQPFKASLAEGFEQIYTVMQGIADRIRGTVIPAVSELTSSLSKVATEISSIVRAGELEIDVHTPNTATASYSRSFGGRKRAEGGIITRPEIALIGEAGREAVIPLEKQARGATLWYEAGRELGLLQNNMVLPHADGGIFSQPHIGLVAEAGREAIIPLENRSRGIPLWQAAGEEMGVSFGNPQSSREISAVFAPNLNLTVNGGEPDAEQKFRRIVSDMFEDLFAEFQSKIQRLAFE